MLRHMVHISAVIMCSIETSLGLLSPMAPAWLESVERNTRESFSHTCPTNLTSKGAKASILPLSFLVESLLTAS